METSDKSGKTDPYADLGSSHSLDGHWMCSLPGLSGCGDGARAAMGGKNSKLKACKFRAFGAWRLAFVKPLRMVEVTPKHV